MDENSETLTPESLPDDASGNVDESTGGEGTVSESNPDGLSLNEINEHLGKEFPTKEAALKAFKDTFSHIGKQQEVVKDELEKTGDYVSRDEFNREMFFKDNPEHLAHRQLLEDLAKVHNRPMAEIVEMDSYKTVYEKVKGYDESQSAKSVLESNPRLGAVRDSMTQAEEKMGEMRKAQQAGDAVSAEANYSAARSNATKAVLDAYDLDN